MLASKGARLRAWDQYLERLREQERQEIAEAEARRIEAERLQEERAARKDAKRQKKEEEVTKVAAEREEKKRAVEDARQERRWVERRERERFEHIRNCVRRSRYKCSFQANHPFHMEKCTIRGSDNWIVWPGYEFDVSRESLR